MWVHGAVIIALLVDSSVLEQQLSTADETYDALRMEQSA